MSMLLDPKWQVTALAPLMRLFAGKGYATEQQANTALRALMLPGDVYQGNVSMYGADGRTNPEVINRSADLAGMVTLGAGAIPAEANSMRMGASARRAFPAIKPSSDDVSEVLSANFEFGDVVGNRTLPINKIFPSGTAQTADQAGRVTKLMDAINGPQGYISRLIVDDQGNIVEGQHRYEAMKNLGYKEIPVTVIKDRAKGMDIGKMREAISSAGKLRSDNVNQIISSVVDMVAETGSPQKALEEFDFPRGFEAHFRAALESLIKAKN